MPIHSEMPACGSKVLLLTLGSTPQVVTETLFALVNATPQWVPDRIVLATTGHGARLFREGRAKDDRNIVAPMLGSDGMLARMLQELNLPLSLDCVEVCVPCDTNGSPIEDIRTEEETKAFAEELLRIVARITSAPESELHVSLAGGRKTMSFIAGQVMSIFGRKQDYLSHVLVEPRELEWQDSFWWPGDGSPGSDKAHIQLYLVPYLKARAWVDPDHVMDVSPGFADAVDIANQSLGRVQAKIDLVGMRLDICGRQIELGAQQLATLGLIAIAAKRGLPIDTVTDWKPEDRKTRGLTIGGDRELAHRLWAFLYHCCDLPTVFEGGPVVHFGPFDRAIAESLSEFSVNDKVASPLSRMRQELNEELPPVLAEKIIAPKGYATLLHPADITIIGPADLAEHPEWPLELSIRA